MFLELHILQNFAPSNLNRDDTGSPKTAEFGGYRRARISSQAIKRAIRNEFKAHDLIPGDHRAVRTKRVLTAVAERLIAQGREPSAAEAVVTATLGALEIGIVARPDAEVDLSDADGRRAYFDDQKSQYLLYLGEPEITRIVGFCDANWEKLVAVTTAPTGRRAKQDTRKAVEDAVGRTEVSALKASLDGGKAADLALFGRMLADLPERNIDAASQVAHALSTHRVGVEFDYYTAVDELKPEDTAGADMIGTVEFNSACYYRYANIDLGQLKANLGGDSELAASTVRAFLVASRDAIPTGKQNSFAARNAPSFVFAAVRNGTCWSLVNAFVNPIRARENKDLVAGSIEALDRHWGELVRVYGTPTDATLAVCKLGDDPLTNLGPHEVATFDAVVEKTLGAVQSALAS